MLLKCFLLQKSEATVQRCYNFFFISSEYSFFFYTFTRFLTLKRIIKNFKNETNIFNSYGCARSSLRRHK